MPKFILQSQTFRNLLLLAGTALTPIAVEAYEEGRLPTGLQEVVTLGLIGYGLYHGVEGRTRLGDISLLPGVSPSPEKPLHGPVFGVGTYAGRVQPPEEWPKPPERLSTSSSSQAKEALQSNSDSLNEDQSGLTPSPKVVVAQEPDLNKIAKLPSEVKTFAQPVQLPVADADDIHEMELDFEVLEGKYTVTALQSTKVKDTPADSQNLERTSWKQLTKGVSFEVDAWDVSQGQHVRVDTDRGIYYLYAPHVRLTNLKGDEVSLIKPAPQRDRGRIITLPGQGKVGTNDPVYPGSRFTWGEVTKGGTRIPEHPGIVEQAIKMAVGADDIRAHFGNRPVLVTSWYRDPVTNAAVGGATRSSHLTGGAFDFYIPGLDIWYVQEEMVRWWKRGGVGKGAPRKFIHAAVDGWVRSWDY